MPKPSYSEKKSSQEAHTEENEARLERAYADIGGSRFQVAP